MDPSGPSVNPTKNAEPTAICMSSYLCTFNMSPGGDGTQLDGPYGLTASNFIPSFKGGSAGEES